MTDKKTTHDAMVETLTRPYTEPPKQTDPTTHDINAERYVERFHTDPSIQDIVNVLSTSSETKRDAIKRALAGDTK